MEKIIGIDLGTTNSVVAIMEGDLPKVITNSEGNRITPSVVAFTDKDERLVGQLAKRQAVINPKNTVFSIKRFMGRRHNEVGEEEKLVPYEIAGGPEELVKVEARGKSFTPPEISAMVLQNLKKTAEDYLGTEVKKAVITVPAYFNDSQRQATKNAGEIAGLNVLRIINEPTSAALSYGLDKQETEHTILVFDFGGGTFDVSILELGDGLFEVKSTSGDNLLGGDDVDDLLINHIASSFKAANGIDLKADPVALQRLKEAAEKAKIELSTKMKVEVSIPFITADQNGPKHVKEEITRAKFEEMLAPVLKRLEAPVKAALKDAKMTSADIHKVIFVGGSTRIPSVQALVKTITGKEGDKSVNPDEAVSLGAAIQAGVISGDVKDVLLLDVTPLSLGIETLGGVFTQLIERNSTIPTKKSQIFSTAADNQPAVTIRVAQGERSMFADNKTLGQFDLSGIPPAPRGVPQIEVAFDIDANGIVSVSAKDLATAKEQSIKITGSSNLSSADIEKMRADAEAHAEEDLKRKNTIEAQNNAESTIYQTNKLLTDMKDKISDEQKKDIEAKVADLEAIKTSENFDDINAKLELLTNAVQEVTTKIYQEAAAAAQAAQGAGATAAPGADAKEAKDEKVVDADFEEKKEEKKE